jgi:putative ABC transport system permease protein
MQTLWQDLRYGLRMLGKNPGFTLIAVLTLALAIGANTAIFSVVYGALLSPLPYPNSDELVMIWSNFNGHKNQVSAADYLDWKRQNAVFQDIVSWTSTSFTLSRTSHPEVLQARVTSPGFFTLQGIPLLMGRDFLPDESQAGKNHVLIMTHRLWQERFAGDSHVVGRQFRLDGEPYTVVGVLSEGMPDRFESQIFVPLTFKPDQINHDRRWLAVMGRLKPGITLQQANADMAGVTQRLGETYPASNKGWSASVEPLKNNFTGRDTIKDLWLLMGAVGFVLLIACVNVANLLLARGSIRQKEVALRASLGATRWRLFSQQLTETLVLALIGGGLGVGLASALLKVILVLLPPFSIPTEADVRLNVPVLLFSLAVTLFAGVLCGCAPAWQGSRLNPADSLKEGGRSGPGVGRHRLRRSLVVLEFALALTLLAGAGLIIHSFWKLTRIDLGFRQDHILTFVLPVRAERFSGPEQMTALYRQMLDKIGAIPGVSSVAASTGAPIVGTNSVRFAIFGEPVGDLSSRPNAGFTMATPGYFRTFGIPIVMGRSFTEQDVAGALPVALVNETFAKKYLPTVDPLTQRIVVEQPIPGAVRPGPPIEWHVVGVYRDVLNSGVRRDTLPEINVAFWQSPWPSARIEVRTNGDPSSLTGSVAAAVQSMDPDLALDQVQTMDQLVDDSLAGDRFATVLFAAFAMVALVLAAIGIYGVMSFVLAQRTHEIGLRMALGASARQVLLMALREGVVLALAGVVPGLAGAYIVGHAMKSVLYEISAIDPIAIGGVAIVLLLAAVLASYLPAHRATRVDPMVALRYE